MFADRRAPALPRWVLSCLLALLVLCLLPRSEAAEPVRLQLKWTHAFQFAGYYAAKELGYYRAAGLDVEIREVDKGMGTVDAVVSGRAEFGVGTSSLLLERKAGKPVVALAAIFQHSPQVIIAAATDAAQGVHDLADKRVMFEPQSEELLAYLRREGVPLERIRQLPHSYHAEDLIKGRTDAMSAYLTSEPFYLDRARFRYQMYTPRSAGIDFYGDTLFTSQELIKTRPELVRAFRDASLQGWKYAMAHPEEIARLIHARYSSAHELDYYRFEARQMKSLVQAEFVELGYMHEGRWRHIANAYAELGLLPREFALDGFIYQPNPQRDLGWLYRTLAIGAILLLLVSGVALRFANLTRKLRESDSRFRTLFSAMPDPAWLIRGGRFVDANAAAVQALGFADKDSLLAQPPAALAPVRQPDGSSSAERLGEELALATKLGRHSFDFVFAHRDGSALYTEVTLAEVTLRGEPALYCIWRDVSARRAAEERIRHLAQLDPLTELPNRALLFDRLQQALAKARRERSRVAVMFFDLDGFKPINDTFGHDAGDRLLKETARRIAGGLRESDTVARIGGDEFLVLLPQVEDVSSARVVAEKISTALQRPFDLGNGAPMHISASIGVAIYPEDGDEANALVRSADTAMYRAKGSGGNRVAFYSQRGAAAVQAAEH